MMLEDNYMHQLAGGADDEVNEEIHVQCKVEREYKSSLDGAFKPKHSSIVQVVKSKIHLSLNKHLKCVL